MVRRSILAPFACALALASIACRAPEENTYSDIRWREQKREERPALATVEAGEAPPAIDIDAIKLRDLDNTAAFDPGHGQARQAFVRRGDIALAQLEGELGMLDAQVAAMDGRLAHGTAERDHVRYSIRAARNELERIRVGASTATEKTRDLVAVHIDEARRALLSAREQMASAVGKM